MKANIVVGIGFGDEGKGITTDYLCSKAKNPIVIRYCGGQQAGHTVMLDDKKHIHSNFGSGTLRGIPSYFSEHTVFYPTTIAREQKVLKKKGIKPRLILHPLAKMTTPWDVFENRQDSTNLNDGSCGLGIGKTMKRNESPFKLYAIDLLYPYNLHEKVYNISKHYYNYPDKLTDNQRKEYLDFVDAIGSIKWEIKGYEFLKEFDELIFEGSQGVMLDMDHGVFPNVTFANTTSKNAHEILDKLGITDRHMYYVTRCYSTRHGSGPFDEENLHLINNEEEINVYNEYQKEFKIGDIDYNLLSYALGVDGIYSDSKVVTKNLMITCLDQRPDFKFISKKLSIRFASIYESYSPKSENILKKF